MDHLRTKDGSRWLAKVRGWELDRFPSEFDSSLEVAAIAVKGGKNRKTGAMITVWFTLTNVPILPAMDGEGNEQRGICGDCVLAPIHQRTDDGFDGTCYVNEAQAPNSIQRASMRGTTYPPADDEAWAYIMASLRRIGGHGDIGCAPRWLAEKLTGRCDA